jgi:hydrogenase maturation protease
VLVIGFGNELRRDDGAGIAVVRRLAAGGLPDGVVVGEEHGEPIGLVERWRTCEAVVLVDTVRSGAAPGTVRRIDASAGPLPGELRRPASTHAIGLAAAIELARALDRVPRRLIVHAVEGRRFDMGATLSPEVAAAVPALTAAVLGEARAFRRRRVLRP